MIPLIKLIPAILSLSKVIPLDVLAQKVEQRRKDKADMKDIDSLIPQEILIPAFIDTVSNTKVSGKDFTKAIHRDFLSIEMMFLLTALREYGVTEVPGSKHSERIMEYAAKTGLSEDYMSDEMSWCSLFLCYVAESLGLIHPKSLSARSWLNCGDATDEPQPGDVVILWRESPTSWKGHVGIFVAFDKPKTGVYLLGGNQSNHVCIAGYDSSRILGFRKLRYKIIS